MRLWLPIVSLAACTTIRPVVPLELEPAKGLVPALRVSARGTQNYRCDEAGPAWKLVAPDAVLVDTDGRRVGQHGAGPSWVLDDGSAIAGDSAAARKSPSPLADAIPWLHVPTRPNGAEGGLSKVTVVLRVNTRGGQAPATGCDRQAVGAEVKVPYTADYVFFR